MADQTVTFTRNSGVTTGDATITVTVPDHNNDTNVVDDNELGAAATSARASHSGIDLSNYSVAGVAADRYTAAIASGGAAAAPGAPAVTDDIPVAPSPTSYNEVGLSGRYIRTFGDPTPGNGGGIDAFYGRVFNVAERFRLHVRGGLSYNSFSSSYTLPGSVAGTNDASSTFNMFGPYFSMLGNIPVADRNRFMIDLGLRLGVYGAWTPSSHMVDAATGPGCVAAGGGRQCEETPAGNATADDGTAGGYDSRRGSSRSQSGAVIDVAGYAGVSYRIPVGGNSLDLGLGALVGRMFFFTDHNAPGQTYVAPTLTGTYTF